MRSATVVLTADERLTHVISRVSTPILGVPRDSDTAELSSLNCHAERSKDDQRSARHPFQLLYQITIVFR